ncbi:MAG: hypothetical protein N2201_05015 [candidate division WOR-3 bacterium]|nr:hypothetical protein [candidate division WOR-3 bacterium]
MVTIGTGDSLPPLPFDKLWKIEMTYQDTSFKRVKIDSFYIQVRTGNIFSGDLLLSKLLGKKLSLSFSLQGVNDYDFSRLFKYNSTINLICLTKNFLQEFGFAVQKKKRVFRYYDGVILSYTPTWFIDMGALQLNAIVRGTRYFDRTEKKILLTHSNFIFNYPTLLGNINTTAQGIFQNQFYSLIKFNDLITLGDKFFIKPEVAYDIKKSQLGVGLHSGFHLGNFTLLTNFSKNQTEICYFDTLYQHIYPIIINNNLDYPINDWYGTIALSTKHHQILVLYQQSQSYLTFNLQDSWLILTNSQSKLQQYTFKLQNYWRFLNSSTVLSYTPNELPVIPKYFFAESLQVIFNNFDINLRFLIMGNRYFYPQRLFSYWVFTSEIGYNLIFLSSQFRLRKLRFSFCAENIFNQKYEILPNKFDFGRKLTISLAYAQ